MALDFKFGHRHSKSCSEVERHHPWMLGVGGGGAKALPQIGAAWRTTLEAQNEATTTPVVFRKYYIVTVPWSTCVLFCGGCWRTAFSNTYLAYKRRDAQWQNIELFPHLAINRKLCVYLLCKKRNKLAACSCGKTTTIHSLAADSAPPASQATNFQPSYFPRRRDLQTFFVPPFAVRPSLASGLLASIPLLAVQKNVRTAKGL